MIKFKAKVRFRSEVKGRKRLEAGTTPKVETGRVPRVARMMSLAIRFDRLIRSGVVADQADLARLGKVSRARITQIMMLLNLAPEIQDEILFLPRIESGGEPVKERELRPVAGIDDWQQQVRSFRRLRSLEYSIAKSN